MIRIFPCLPYNQGKKPKQSEEKRSSIKTNQMGLILASLYILLLYPFTVPTSQCIEILPTISEEKESLFLTF